MVGSANDNNDNHLVTMFPKETCTCRLRINFHHITAVRVSLKKEGIQCYKTCKYFEKKKNKERAGRKNPIYLPIALGK